MMAQYIGSTPYLLKTLKIKHFLTGDDLTILL